MRENVGITITKILRSLDLFENIDKLVFVTDRQTDRGANIVAALRRFTSTTLKKWGRKV
jgi:hypothetical protein